MKTMKITIAAMREGTLDLWSLIYTLRGRPHPTPSRHSHQALWGPALAERHHPVSCEATSTDGARLQLVSERREVALIKAATKSTRWSGIWED